MGSRCCLFDKAPGMVELNLAAARRTQPAMLEPSSVFRAVRFAQSAWKASTRMPTLIGRIPRRFRMGVGGLAPLARANGKVRSGLSDVLSVILPQRPGHRSRSFGCGLAAPCLFADLPAFPQPVSRFQIPGGRPAPAFQDCLFDQISVSFD